MLLFRSSSLYGAALAIASSGFLTIATAPEIALAQDNPFEELQPNEAELIEETAKATVALQTLRAKEHAGQEGRLLRGVHAKSHGCVKAEFVVEQTLREEHRRGLFAQPGKQFSAWIRFSNASVLREDDLKADKEGTRQNGSRGMAIKLLDVSGAMLDLDDGAQNQDFLMINTPEFAFADVRTYARLTKILTQSPKGDDPDKFFIPLKLQELGEPKAGEPAPVTSKRDLLKKIMAENPTWKDFGKADLVKTLGSLKVIKKIQSAQNTVRNPLQAQYFGAAPFLFGQDHVMKFSAAPCNAVEPKPFTDVTADNPAMDYLQDSLSTTMQGNQAQCFDFKIQVRDSKAVDQLNIEDATTVWPDELKNYVTVAKIHIETPQQPQTDEAVEHCERLAFSPWHSLVDHQPLGSINRLRRNVYSGSAAHRSSGTN